MVATLLPAPQQLMLLPAPPAPAVQDAAYRRLLFHLRRMHYGDALTAGTFRLERQCFEWIEAEEDDSAPDGTLVQASYVQFILFVSGRLHGVVEVRSAGVLDRVLQKLARKLLSLGWQIDKTHYAAGCALVAPDSPIGERARRLLKGQR